MNYFSNCYFLNYIFMYVEANTFKFFVILTTLFDLIFYLTIAVEVNTNINIGNEWRIWGGGSFI